MKWTEDILLCEGKSKNYRGAFHVWVKALHNHWFFSFSSWTAHVVVWNCISLIWFSPLAIFGVSQHVSVFLVFFSFNFVKPILDYLVKATLVHLWLIVAQKFSLLLEHIYYSNCHIVYHEVYLSMVVFLFLSC